MRRPLKTAARRALPLIAVMAALTPRPAVSDDANARRRFFEEAPAAWAKMEAAYADGLVIEGEERFTTTEPDSQGLFPDRARPIRFARAGESSRFECVYWPGMIAAAVLTPDHCFDLHRESTSSPYEIAFFWGKPLTTLLKMVTRVALHPPGSRFAAGAADGFESFAREELSSRIKRSFVSRSIIMPFSTGDGQPLAQVLTNPEFRITSVAEVVRYGRDLVKVDFKYHPVAPSNHHAGSGWWLFDPARLWTLQSSEFVSKHGRLDSSIEYGDDDEAGYPSIRRAQIVHLDREGDEAPRAEIEVFEVKSWRRRILPESEFQLSAFEIAERDKIAVAGGPATR